MNSRPDSNRENDNSEVSLTPPVSTNKDVGPLTSLSQTDELLVMLEDDQHYRKVRAIYFSGFNPMHINRCPQTPFVAADQSDKAAVDTNWFAWWTKRGYIYLETISLIWKNEQWPQD